MLVTLALLVGFLSLFTPLQCFKFTSVSRFTQASRYAKCTKSTVTMDFDWKSARKSAEERMIKSVESTQAQLNTLRAGGANPAMLDRVQVDYYGAPTPLNQLARVAASGAQLLIVEPFDKTICKDVEKAITMAELNLTPTNDGSGVIRINIPPLTEDRRKQLVKQAKNIVEEGKVAVRNIRRDSADKVKQAEKDKEISKDDSKGCQVSSLVLYCLYFQY